MPLTVFQTRGIPSARRERIIAAIEAGGKHISGPFEAWVTADDSGHVHVVITGPQNFDRRVLFAVDEAETEITERVRRTVEE
jgi:hypothetical protein